MTCSPTPSPSTPFTRGRADEIAAFFAREARALEHAVARTVHAPAAMIEDACAHAWCQLVRHDEVELGPGGFWWLYTCAKHEVFRMCGRSRREPAAGVPSELPERLLPPCEPVEEAAERRAEHEARQRLLARLSERKRRMLVLHAAGFTYEEIATASGDSARTVERQLLRGRRSLSRAVASMADG